MSPSPETIDFAQLERRTYYRGRVALHAILKALGIGPGDHVATQAFTCVAVPEAILAAGATPLYIDIESDGYNLDAASLRQRLTPTTRAIVVQHTFGIPAAMEGLQAVAEEHGLPIVEDCCHTFLSKYAGQYVGTFGKASFFSYEWGKPMAVGLGGGAVANDPELAAALDAAYSGYAPPSLSRRAKIEAQRLVHRLLYRPSFYWMLKSAFERLSRLGAAEGNYNAVDQQQVADDFSLTMAPRLRRTLTQQMAALDNIAAQSRRWSEQYARQLAGSNVELPQATAGSEPVFSRYPVRTDDKPRLIARAREARIELAPWYTTPVHPLPAEALPTAGYEPGECPEAEARAAEIVSLPLGSRVGARYVQRVGDLFREAA